MAGFKICFNLQDRSGWLSPVQGWGISQLLMVPALGCGRSEWLLEWKLNWVVPPTSWPWYSGSCGRAKLKARTKVKTSGLVTLRRKGLTRTLLAKECSKGIAVARMITEKILLLREQKGLSGKFCMNLETCKYW